jgi:hypothetical protein
MSSIMRWRSGLMASVLMGTPLSEVDDTSILRKRAHGPPSLFFQMLTVPAKKPSPQRAIAVAI